jgi:hypothetical protein
VDAVYSVDKNIAAVLESGVGEYFELGFRSEDRRVRVYLVKSTPAVGGVFEQPGSRLVQTIP